MSRRGINDETRSIGLGCIDLDVEMARAHGWTEADIKTTWETISAAVRSTSAQVARRAGHTRQCLVCECWTFADRCHLCDLDKLRAAGQQVSRAEWTCSCGRKFAALAQLDEHTREAGGLMHGDAK